MFTPSATIARASASVTMCAMVGLPCLRACSNTAATTGGVSFGTAPPWASIHTLMKSAAGAISSTVARAPSGVSPGTISAGRVEKRRFTVRIRAPRRSPRFWAALKATMSSGSRDIEVVVVMPYERVLPQLRVAVLSHVAVGVDDAGGDELAPQIDDRGASRRLHLRAEIGDPAVAHHDGDAGLRRRPGAVDHRCVGERHILRLCADRAGTGEEEAEADPRMPSHRGSVYRSGLSPVAGACRPARLWSASAGWS